MYVNKSKSVLNGARSNAISQHAPFATSHSCEKCKYTRCRTRPFDTFHVICVRGDIWNRLPWRWTFLREPYLRQFFDLWIYMHMALFNKNWPMSKPLWIREVVTRQELFVEKGTFNARLTSYTECTVIAKTKQLFVDYIFWTVHDKWCCHRYRWELRNYIYKTILTKTNQASTKTRAASYRTMLKFDHNRLLFGNMLYRHGLASCLEHRARAQLLLERWCLVLLHLDKWEHVGEKRCH